MVNLGYVTVRFENTETLLKTVFLTIDDTILRGVTIGIDRPASKKAGSTRVTISAEARLRYSDPAVLAKLHRTALDHISSAPALGGVHLKGHWNSIIAVVELDINPVDYTFKGEVGVSLVAKMLDGVIGDLKQSIAPYVHQ